MGNRRKVTNFIFIVLSFEATECGL